MKKSTFFKYEKKTAWKYSSKFLICITIGKEFSLRRVKQRGKRSWLTKVIPTWQHSEMRMERILFFQIHPWFVQISLRLLKNFLEEAEVYFLQPFAFGETESKKWLWPWLKKKCTVLPLLQKSEACQIKGPRIIIWGWASNGITQ